MRLASRKSPALRPERAERRKSRTKKDTSVIQQETLLKVGSLGLWVDFLNVGAPFSTFEGRGLARDQKLLSYFLMLALLSFLHCWHRAHCLSGEVTSLFAAADYIDADTLEEVQD